MNDIPLFLRNLEHLKGQSVRVSGKDSEGVVTLLAAPRWDVKTGKWTALANVGGALCIIEVKLTQTGDKDA